MPNEREITTMLILRAEFRTMHHEGGGVFVGSSSRLGSSIPSRALGLADAHDAG